MENSDSSHSDISELRLNEDLPEAVKVQKLKRITSARMTKFEKAYIIGVRAEQLSMNAPPLVDIDYEIDPLKIALKELKEKKLPFIIRRTLPDNCYEEWDVNELFLPFD